MTWRPMRSLAEAPASQTTGLRGQVNALAPNRSKASDGLVGDQNHESTSGHFPHTVPGVGDEIVTAWDCTNDPGGGCDSRRLAETLRQHRDPRIRYVISARQIFYSVDKAGLRAWTWGPYTGVDPHTNHAHIQVLDAPISDTTTPWNLEGFDQMSVAEVTQGIKDAEFAAAKRTALPGTEATDPTGKYGRALNDFQNEIAARQLAPLVAQLDEVKAALAELDRQVKLILAKLEQGTPAPGPAPTTGTGTFTWVSD